MEDRLMVDMRISADCTEMEAEDTVIPSKDARRGEWRLPRRGQKGFTIVEVLVALLILLATATMTAQLSIQAIHTSYSQQQRSTAMTLSLAGMEQVRSTVRGISGSEYFASLTKYYDESSSESVAKKLNEYGVLQIDGDFSDLKGDMSVVYAESAADTSGVSDPLVPSTVLNKNGTDYTINTAGSAIEGKTRMAVPRPPVPELFPAEAAAPTSCALRGTAFRKTPRPSAPRTLIPISSPLTATLWKPISRAPRHVPRVRSFWATTSTLLC